MSPGMLTSTFRVLESLQAMLSPFSPASIASITETWQEKWKKLMRMVLISTAVGGIELCYSAETAFVSPLLLQLGVPAYWMSISWMVSPLLGFFIVPLLGSASDTCTSNIGRRRPFIFLYSVGIICGLLLVPFGKDIGELLGDSDKSLVEEGSSDYFPGNLTLNITTLSQIPAAQSHHIGRHFLLIQFHKLANTRLSNLILF